MVTKNSCEGMIFLLYDKCSTLDGSKHNYIILATNEQNERLGLLQCMSITSMRAKEITLEVPILLSNDMVSYIVPYNIHSFTSTEIELKNFKGCLTDVDYISKYEFMQLLIDIYADSMDLGLVDHDDVMRRYHDYCDKFWEVHKDCIEFREYEQELRDRRRAYIEPLPQLTEEQVQEVVQNQVELKPVIVQNTSSTNRPDVKRKTKKHQYKSSKKMSRKSKESARRKQAKIEKKEFDDMVRECVGSTALEVEPETSTVEETISVEEEIAIAVTDEEAVTEPVITRFIIPFKEESIIANNIRLEELAILNETPRASKDFTDKELVLFLKGYEKYKYDDLKSVIPDKWNSPTAFKQFYSSVKKEAMSRKIVAPMGPGLFPDDKFNRPCAEWSDNELRQYLDLSANHKRDPQFMLQLTGYDNINSVNQRSYQVKKEAVARKLVTL